MKKLYMLFIFFALISSNNSFADCTTGYACSIHSLQAKNRQIESQFLKELNNYFELKVNEDFMLGNIENFRYKDLFPFTIIL